MKRLLLLLLLSGCGSQAPEEPVEKSNAPPLVAPPEDVAANASVDVAALQARVDAAMKNVLQDAAGAVYRNLRPGLADSICGEVDPAKRGGGHSGFRPFILGSDNAVILSRGPTLSFDDPSDPFPDLYIRWCASDEELKQLGPQLDRSLARAAGPDNILPGVDDIPEPEPEPAEPAPAARPVPVPSEKMGSGESFFDSVRKPREPAPAGK
jgi:hypothetical protein